MTVLDGPALELLSRRHLGYVATVSPDCTPNLSPKGTIIAWGSDMLAFADIRSPNTVRNISSNPNVEINIVDPLLRKGFCFSGTAKIVRTGSTFDDILAHYRNAGVKNPIGAVILVNVLHVTPITSPLYDLGLTEDEVESVSRRRLLGS